MTTPAIARWGLKCPGIGHLTLPKPNSFSEHSIVNSTVKVILRYFNTSRYVSDSGDDWQKQNLRIIVGNSRPVSPNSFSVVEDATLCSYPYHCNQMCLRPSKIAINHVHFEDCLVQSSVAFHSWKLVQKINNKHVLYKLPVVCRKWQ